MSDIPYAGKFGGTGKVDMTLAEYIDEVSHEKLSTRASNMIALSAS